MNNNAMIGALLALGVTQLGKGKKKRDFEADLAAAKKTGGDFLANLKKQLGLDSAQGVEGDTNGDGRLDAAELAALEEADKLFMGEKAPADKKADAAAPTDPAKDVEVTPAPPAGSTAATSEEALGMIAGQKHGFTDPDSEPNPAMADATPTDTLPSQGSTTVATGDGPRTPESEKAASEDYADSWGIDPKKAEPKPMDDELPS